LIKRDVALTKILFFLFGIEIMCWVPRFPELKANLGVNNGLFGTMLSVGAIGSLIALLVMGHWVDHFGAKNIFILGSTLLTIAFIATVHVHNHKFFILFNMLIGFSISTLHTANNAQAFFDQERGGKNLVVSAAGYWSAGSLTTIFLSMYLIGKVSLKTHVSLLLLITWVFTLTCVFLRKDTLVPSNRHENIKKSILADFRKFNFDWLVNFGMIFGILLEFSVGDWSSIFAKENGGISETWAPLPFMFFTISMIVGRVSINQLRKRYKISTLVRIGGIVAGTSYLIGIWTVHIFGLLGLVITFSLAGLGSSYIGPSFLNVANSRIDLPASIVIGQISAVNVVLSWILKQLVALLAQFAGLQIALTLPALMAISVGLFAKVFKQVPAK
jgi:MFS family permease